MVARRIAAQESRHTRVGVIRRHRVIARLERAPSALRLQGAVGNGFHQVKVRLDAQEPQLLLQESGPRAHLLVALDGEQIGLVKVKVVLFQQSPGFGPNRVHILRHAPAGDGAQLFLAQFPRAARRVTEPAHRGVAVLQHLNRRVAVNPHYDGLPHLDIVQGRNPRVNPQPEVPPRGPDDRVNLLVVHIGLVLTPVPNPVPIRLMRQLRGLLRGLIQDAVDNQFIHVGQSLKVVVGVLVKILGVHPNRLAVPPNERPQPHPHILEHRLFAAFLKPSFVENLRPAIRQGQQQHRLAARANEVHLQGHIVNAAQAMNAIPSAVADIRQPTLHIAGRDAHFGNHRLKGEPGILAGKGIAVVPGRAGAEIKGNPVQPLGHFPALRQVGNDRRAGIIRVLHHQQRAGRHPIPVRHARTRAPRIGVFQGILIVNPQPPPGNHIPVKALDIVRNGQAGVHHRHGFARVHHPVRRLRHRLRHRGRRGLFHPAAHRPAIHRLAAHPLHRSRLGHGFRRRSGGCRYRRRRRGAAAGHRRQCQHGHDRRQCPRLGFP